MQEMTLTPHDLKLERVALTPRFVHLRASTQAGSPTGITAETAPTRALALVRGVLPPGVRAPAHVHVGFDAVIFVVSGRVQSWYGPGLMETVVAGPGDFLFIPEGLPHQPQNLSEHEEVVALVARTAVGTEEPTAPYPHDTRAERVQIERLYAALARDDESVAGALLHPLVRLMEADGSACEGKRAVLAAWRRTVRAQRRALSFDLDASLRVTVRGWSDADAGFAHAFTFEDGLVRAVCAVCA